MPLTPDALNAALYANRGGGASFFGGDAYQRLIQGVSLAVSQWAVGNPTNVTLQGIVNGPSGAGTISSSTAILTVPPNVLVMREALTGAGLEGALAESLAPSMALGISQAFLSSSYSGVSVGVATGLDASKVVIANPISLIALLTSILPGSLGGVGLAMPLMARGLGNGIADLVLLGSGTATVTGVPTIPSVPAVGTTTSVVV